MRTWLISKILATALLMTALLPVAQAAIDMTPIISVSTCSTTNTGSQSACGTVTLQGSGSSGSLTSSDIAYSLNGDTSQYVFTNTGGCYVGKPISSGYNSCTLGNITFKPTQAGSWTLTIKAGIYQRTDSVSGTATNPYTYSWYQSGWGSCSLSCGTGTQSQTVYCRRSDGAQVSDGNCTGTKPASSQSCSVYSGCTYGFSYGGWGACTGGSGTWGYSAWTPTNGCGSTSQTRTASCNPNANSATQYRSYTCYRSDGAAVADAYCGTPSNAQNCTPTSGYSCGTQGATSQVIELTNTCSYSWNFSAWSAPSSTCSANVTQTRTVWCQRSDGTTVADTSCTGTKPASSQTVANYSGCTYSWSQSSWNSCTGGSGTWDYSTWTPTMGCGTTAQTRTASCNADTNSAAQTRSVTCLRSDGTTVSDASCTGTKPSTSQSCTPTSGFSCGTQAPLSQSTLLTSTCSYAWVTGSWSASSNTCSATATQTRSVSCRRSDGTTVADASCTGSKPASSQTVADFSTCTYSWSQSSWSGCTSGTGTWAYSVWTPTTGCGTTSQTRTASCNADASSATQTRSVTCLRSDGTTVADASCGAGKPTASQSCTPTSGFSCGTQQALSQDTLLTDTCSYAWATGAWSAPNNTCSANAIRTRGVTCHRSDGTIVSDASCAETKPATSQAVQEYSGCAYSWDAKSWSDWNSTCSETAHRTREVFCLRSEGSYVAETFCTTAKPATQDSAEVLTGCSYSWTATGFGACAGGSYSWATGTWGPTMGCGQVEQTRQATCAVDVNSGSHAQSVGCRRSDGVDVFASFCDVETRPATTEACTPPQSLCVDPPSNTQTVTLDTSCMRDAILQVCEPAKGEGFCVVVPLH